ncbi:formylglycine-generating enzyme family protein [candidate division WOR-3 bacterium]|uniref:Formylglycine-generating enzyme family protein n=1 Tax=candidate division WOR-3 bacterium TaxID=2052148 RepID=A0A937XHP4_UNCW3|nr:formylglycine-generating enzyme family protein [candidate division WOR-3 bacterium]
MNRKAGVVDEFVRLVGGVAAIVVTLTPLSTFAAEDESTEGIWRPLGKNAQGYEECLWLRDSSVMVKVPAGVFTMGSDGDQPCEKPAHEVYLDEFWIDKCEVTNRQYKRFCDATERKYPRDPDDFDVPDYFKSRPDYPVVNVSWEDADAYCSWAGKRLPTEAEWEKAARGTDARKYPWGSRRPGSSRHGNFADDALGRWHPGWPRINGYDDGYSNTAPVGSFALGASPYGCMDMAGNVYEWCSDYYSDDYFGGSTKNPTGPRSGSSRVIRSSSWSRAGDVLCVRRSSNQASCRTEGLGFRCCGPAIPNSQRAVVEPEPPRRGSPDATHPTQEGNDTMPPMDLSPPDAGAGALPASNEQKWQRDGSVMVRVLGGNFTMGSDRGESDEKPTREVNIAEFWIDRCEVTNRQYKHFCDATNRVYPSDPGFPGMSSYFRNRPDYPVVNVSFDDAQAYCEWAGKRLPTEAEWEKAARGIDQRTYPWGEWDPNNARCNSSSKADGYAYTAPVGSFPAGASPCGALDMAGNVREWCKVVHDYTINREMIVQARSVQRGGSADLPDAALRCSSRSWRPARGDYIGFRCCR